MISNAYIICECLICVFECIICQANCVWEDLLQQISQPIAVMCKAGVSSFSIHSLLIISRDQTWCPFSCLFMRTWFCVKHAYIYIAILEAFLCQGKWLQHFSNTALCLCSGTLLYIRDLDTSLHMICLNWWHIHHGHGQQPWLICMYNFVPMQVNYTMDGAYFWHNLFS